MLKAIYDKKEDIPAEFLSLYSERGGKWELTGVEGVKTQADIDRLTEANRKEKNDHAETKAKLRSFDGLDPEAVRTSLAEVDELRIRASKGDTSEEQLTKLVEARLAQKLGPVQRELDSTKKALEAKDAENGTLKGTITKGTIERALRDAATTLKCVPAAIDDICMHAERVFEVASDGAVLIKDNAGYVPGLKPHEWLGEMASKRAHWWPANEGGGAGGSKGGPGGGVNHWAEGSFNMTAQGQYIKEHGAEKAEAMAKAAGSFVGATAPARKSA